MSPYTIHWDAENTHHILVEHAARQITLAEVEEVLVGRNTVKWFTRGGRFFAEGSTAVGRCSRVVYTGINDMQPVTAWPLPRKECDRWQK